MTSGSLFFKRIINDLNHKLWMGAVALLLLFLSLPVYCTRLVERLIQDNYSEYKMENIISYLTGSGVLFIVTIGLAFFIGLTQFSYLFSKTSSDALHSLPVKREELYFTRYLGGVIVYIVAVLLNIILCTILFTVQPQISTGVFHALFAGAGYCLAGFLLVYTTVILAIILCGHMFAGICLSTLFVVYAPVASLVINGLKDMFFLTYDSYATSKGVGLNWFSPASIFYYLITPDREGILSRGTILVLAIVVTLALLVLSVWCYKKRPLENASKALAFPWLGKGVKFFITVLSAFVMGMIFNNVASTQIVSGWFFFGVIFGFLLSSCVTEITLASDFKKAFAHVGVTLVSAIVVVFGILTFQNDLFGYDQFVPKKDQFESAAIYIDNAAGMMSGNFVLTTEGVQYQNDREYCSSHMRITDYSLVKRIAEAGNKLTKVNNNGEHRSFHNIVVWYRLEDGKEVVRGYEMTYDQEENIFNQLFALDAYKQGVSSMDAVSSDLFTGRLSVTTPIDEVFLSLSENEKKEFLTALKKDYYEMQAKDYAATNSLGSLTLHLSTGGDQHQATIYIYPSCKRVTSFLLEKGYDFKTQNAAEKIDRIMVYQDDSLVKTITNPSEINEIYQKLVPVDYSHMNMFFQGTKQYSKSASVYLKNGRQVLAFYD